MKEKKCSKCKIVKPITEFHKNARSKDGYKSACKKCRTKENKKWWKNNKEKEKEYRKKRKNEEKIEVDNKVCARCGKIKNIDEFYKDDASKDNRRVSCKECVLKSNKRYRKINKEKIIKIKKRYAVKNKDKLTAKKKIYYEKNKDKILAYAKKWRKDNREHLNEYFTNLKKINIHRRISVNLRSRVNKAVKNNYKTGSAIRDLGCSINELKEYLESRFQAGMTWDNYGEWHIDHIVPLASFNLENREQLIKAYHYTNLQPLWARDNLSKGAKIIEKIY